MSYKNLQYEVEGAIALITFNRPKALNALNVETLNEFSKALNDVNESQDIKVLILTGAGEKAFVAGADISQLATFNTLEGKLFATLGQEAISQLQALSIPVIAAVNGFALGGGCEIAIACDFIYASEKAKLGLPEITLGLIPGFGGTQRLPRLIGINQAKELIFSGKMLGAKAAKEIGLVNHVFSPESLMDETKKMAQSIAEKGSVSLRAAKEAINNGLGVDLNTGLALEKDAFALCFASDDAKEGTKAFLEKRKAEFKGSLID